MSRTKMAAPVSARIRELRELAGISARKLDDLAGTTPGHTSLLESETRKNLEARTASKFARTLGASLDWLVDGLGEPPSEADVRAAVARAERKSGKAA